MILRRGALIAAIAALFVLPFAASEKRLQAEALSPQASEAAQTLASEPGFFAAFSSKVAAPGAIAAAAMILVPFSLSTLRVLRRHHSG